MPLVPPSSGPSLPWPALADAGVRSDSRATAIVIAAARTASPASWPPMRRGSSGTAEETSVARTVLRALAADDDGSDEEGLGVTVGNRPFRLGGLTVVPAIGASVGGSGKVVGGGGGVVVGGGLVLAPTEVVTDAPAGDNAVPLTVTEKVIGAPVLALGLTLSVTFSSIA